MSETITVEIDGAEYEASKGEMLIAVADRNGVRIPRFCYHEKLSVAANCRMCLVEVERAPKPLPACATPVMDGMKVRTTSKLARNAQKSVMEFLLINHPLDCPICDQGGECELQDVAMGYGRDVSRFVERKRAVEDKDLGPLIATDMTRCIHCTRCVRFGEEIAGLPELGATGRGEFMEIGTFVQKSVDSELSGNMIDVCPVGALTNKPFRFRARTWEMQQRAGVAPHDGVGSNINVHVARNRVMRVIPRENEAVNQVWISDRDRFSHTGLYAADRLQAPLVKRDGEWQSVDWDIALEAAAAGIRRVVEAHGARALGALVSPSATLEEHFLGQKLMRALGSDNVDHRLRETDFRDQDAFPAAPGLGTAIAELGRAQAVLVVGSNARKEHPLINHRLRLAVLAGGSVMTLNATDYGLNYPVRHAEVTSPDRFAEALGAMRTGAESDVRTAIAQRLSQAERAVVLLGPGALTHPRAAEIRAEAAALAKHCEARLGFLTDGANAAGAWLAGCVPHRLAGARAVSEPGLGAAQMLDGAVRGLVLVGVEPSLDCADPSAAARALAAAEHVVAITGFDSPDLRAGAHVLLPMALHAETSGTYVNLEGRWQSMAGAVAPPGEARPAWKVLRVLANRLELEGFEQVDSAEVRDEVAALADAATVSAEGSWRAVSDVADPAQGLRRIGEVPIYAVDALVRRAAPLQATADAAFRGALLSPALAERLGIAEGDAVQVRQGEARARFTAAIDSALADGCVRLASGVRETAGLGPSYGVIEVSRA